ncbi:uncharacterized protein LOC134215102 isoform X2 [Armigeres subalbatus]|uniref:uncharacterized protein LOC134215102 isoform X2 n=1 Tax=Armigeres subalbatus TaxID=124917 RepID=UPI002ED10274
MEQVLQKSEMLKVRFADIKVRVSHMNDESSVGSLTAELDHLESWWKEFKSLQDVILDSCVDDSQLDNVIKELTEADARRNAIKATLKRLLREAQISNQEKPSITIQRLNEQCLLYPKFYTIGSTEAFHQNAPTKQPLEPTPPKHTNAQHAANNVCLRNLNTSIDHNPSLKRFSTAATIENYCLQDENTANSHVSSSFNQSPQEDISQEDIVKQPSSQIVIKTLQPSGSEDQPQFSSQSHSITYHTSKQHSSEIQATKPIHHTKNVASIKKLNEISINHRQQSSTHYEACIRLSANGEQSRKNQSSNMAEHGISSPANGIIHLDGSSTNIAVFRSPKSIDIFSPSHRQFPPLKKQLQQILFNTTSYQHIIRARWAARVTNHLRYNMQVFAFIFIRRRVWEESHRHQQRIPSQLNKSSRLLKVGRMELIRNPHHIDQHHKPNLVSTTSSHQVIRLWWAAWIVYFGCNAQVVGIIRRRVWDKGHCHLRRIPIQPRNSTRSLKSSKRYSDVITTICILSSSKPRPRRIFCKLSLIWWAECCGQQQATGVLHSSTTPADTACLMLPAALQNTTRFHLILTLLVIPSSTAGAS